MAGVTVREYRHEQDYDALIALWNEAGLRHDPEKRDSRESIATQAAGEPAIYLVAESQGRMVGSLLATHDGRKGWLNRAAVHPDFQRMGVGTALAREAERGFRARGITVFACLVEDWNEVSKASSRALGYEEFAATYFRKQVR